MYTSQIFIEEMSAEPFKKGIRKVGKIFTKKDGTFKKIGKNIEKSAESIADKYRRICIGKTPKPEICITGSLSKIHSRI